ncbi:lytic transglycosylase domain-containing protein [Pseudorhodobacter sp. W20_MBD10_FR17]|uniref:lytic transglycosylase domain-containing protein n=1 Tax=Pseudorhodobacter sp. W20_MBD10_FR17 TaxID=3240266 RepID=UPI003F976BD9
MALRGAVVVTAIGGLLAAEAWNRPLAAQTPPYQGDFAARRVVVAKKPNGPRITVQIDPVEQAKRLAVAPKPVVQDAPDQTDVAINAPIAAASAAYGWYWDKVPTAQGAKDGRYALAMASLSQGPAGASVRAPRLQQMQEMAGKYGTEILKATIGTSVSPALVLAVIGIESAGQPEAISSAGAQGLMQLIPATAARFGVTDATDPVQNIKGGVAYLDWLMDQFDRDPLMVLAAYNAGEGAVRANDGVPPYSETRDYVPKVLAAWQVAQGLCLTPPELVSDPCVFKVISAGG